jgi:hypothetical protein
MVYLRISENTNQAKLMLEYLKTLSFVEVIEKDKLPNALTLNAMKDAGKGKVTRSESVNDLISKLRK